jgi:hypothetical protein
MERGKARRPGGLTERQRRVLVIADALDSDEYEEIMAHAHILGEALTHGLQSQKFFTQLAPVLRGHGIKTPPSLHTWRAVRKELLRRAAERVPADWD